jgi:hypothetical protein
MRMNARRIPSMTLLATIVLTTGFTGCAILGAPEGVVGGVELPADLSLVLQPGMSKGDVIARFGAPAKHTRLGQVTTLAYYEVYQEGHDRLRLFGTPVGSDHRTQTQLSLVFLDDALIQAWVEISGIGEAPERKWLLGAPKAADVNPAPPAAKPGELPR